MCLFGYSHPSGCEVVSDCDFDLHFPGSSDTFIVNLPTVSIVFFPSGNPQAIPVLFCFVWRICVQLWLLDLRVGS